MDEREAERQFSPGQYEGPADELEKGINPQDSPGSTQPDTLAGTPGRMAGGQFGREPGYPSRVPPYGNVGVDVTPEGTDGGGPTGTTTGSRTGSTAHGQIGGMTQYNRELEPGQLPRDEDSDRGEE